MADENKLFSATQLKRLNMIAPSPTNKERATSSTTPTSNSQAYPRPELGIVDDTYPAANINANANANTDADADADADGDFDADDGGVKSPEGNHITYSTGEPEPTSPPAQHSRLDGAFNEQGEDKASEDGNVGKQEYPEVPGNDDGKFKAKKKGAEDLKDGSDDDYDGEANNDESDVEEEYEDDGLDKDEIISRKGMRGGLRSGDKK